MPTHHGSCHCGAVTFRIEGEITESYTCDCSLCRKKNALMAKVPQDRLTITSGEDKLSLYQWNTRVAKHYFCKLCGIYPFHRKRSNPDRVRRQPALPRRFRSPEPPDQARQGQGDDAGR